MEYDSGATNLVKESNKHFDYFKSGGMWVRKGAGIFYSRKFTNHKNVKHHYTL